jgi:deoxyribose-phosphate aldolase
MDLQSIQLTTARTALACLDLTSLNDGDTPADIEKLCARAQGKFGHTAAVCVWPRFAALARSLLPADTSLRAALTCNVPCATPLRSCKPAHKKSMSCCRTATSPLRLRCCWPCAVLVRACG